MAILDKHLDLVKSQIQFHLNRAEEYSNSPKRQQKHVQTAKQFQELLDALISEASQPRGALAQVAEHLAAQQAQVPEPRLSLTREELDGLPDELLNELSTSGTDTVGYAILDLLEQRGMMSLDQIIVGLYRELGEVHKRQNVNSRLYRMAQKGLVRPVEGKKGVYAPCEPGVATEDDDIQLPLAGAFSSPGPPSMETYFSPNRSGAGK